MAKVRPGVPVPYEDYLALARHHRECELAGEEMATALSRLAAPTEELAQQRDAALRRWNDHQWPETEEQTQ